MDNAVNRRPLLQETDSDSENSNGNSSIRISTDENLMSIDSEPLFKPHEPADKYYVCYLIFYLLGITTLLPWNFYITADDYWMYKFRDVTNTTIKVTPGNRTPLQKEFTSYLSVASAVPNTLFLLLSPLLNRVVSLSIRMLSSIIIIIVFFIVTTVFVNVDTDSWQEDFFIVTMLTVIILNVASAILGGSVFGIVGKFSPAYITAVISGQALGGIFTALVQIISLALGESSVHSAFVYFMVGNILCFLTLISYIILSKSLYFNFHLNDRPRSEDSVVQSELIRPQERLCYKEIFRKIWVYGICEWFVFVVTLSVYPGVTVLVESEEKGNGNQWSDLYFVPVISYLIFSTGDWIGRLLAGYYQWPENKPWVLVVLNLLRLIFVPLLLVCNAQPRHHLPVLIMHDYYYILLMCLFSISNGYLANIAVICAPKIVNHHEKEVASSMMAAFLGIGLAIGSLISLLMVKII